MSIWLFLIIVFASILIVGPLAGLIIGKAYVKRMQSGRRTVVSRKEALILLAVAIVGGALILSAVISPSGQGDTGMTGSDGGFNQQLGDIGGTPGMVQVMPGIGARDDIVVEEQAPLEDIVDEDEIAEADKPEHDSSANTENVTQISPAVGGVRISGNGGGAAVAVIVGR